MWEDNIKMELNEILVLVCRNTRNLVDLAEERDYWTILMNAAFNLWIS